MRVRLVSASILHDLSDMQPQINAIKIEHPPYYCSSYTPPSAASAADHAQPAASFSPPPVHQLIRNDKTDKAPTVSVSSAPSFSPVLRPEDGHRGIDSPHSQTASELSISFKKLCAEKGGICIKGLKVDLKYKTAVLGVDRWFNSCPRSRYLGIILLHYAVLTACGNSRASTAKQETVTVSQKVYKVYKVYREK
ncbi:hypothetical protein KQX54_004479 [Cotesia glomerata]|uniref:Uncharacterized protein n=1 Tax=Cotesia glomerata TaxID=32391 RepID=A0AAV7ILF7_COTGL|nr:hypothetical protein KQX54_004479 [Cotesia glomerata]